MWIGCRCLCNGTEGISTQLTFDIKIKESAVLGSQHNKKHVARAASDGGSASRPGTYCAGLRKERRREQIYSDRLIRGGTAGRVLLARVSVDVLVLLSRSNGKPLRGDGWWFDCSSQIFSGPKGVVQYCWPWNIPSSFECQHYLFILLFYLVTYSFIFCNHISQSILFDFCLFLYLVLYIDHLAK